VARLIPLVFVLAACVPGLYSLEDFTASISAEVCAGGSVELEGGELTASTALIFCGKAEALGIPLEMCIDWERATDDEAGADDDDAPE
jgi:hypothetical protein